MVSLSVVRLLCECVWKEPLCEWFSFSCVSRPPLFLKQHTLLRRIFSCLPSSLCRLLFFVHHSGHVYVVSPVTSEENLWGETHNESNVKKRQSLTTSLLNGETHERERHFLCRLLLPLSPPLSSTKRSHSRVSFLNGPLSLYLFGSCKNVKVLSKMFVILEWLDRTCVCVDECNFLPLMTWWKTRWRMERKFLTFQFTISITSIVPQMKLYRTAL